jgi:hypothetical protein
MYRMLHLKRNPEPLYAQNETNVNIQYLKPHPIVLMHRLGTLCCATMRREVIVTHYFTAITSEDISVRMV